METQNPFSFIVTPFPHEHIDQDPLAMLRRCQRLWGLTFDTSNQAKYRLIGITAGVVVRLRASPEQLAAFADLEFWRRKPYRFRDVMLETYAVQFLMGEPNPVPGVRARVDRAAKALKILLNEGKMPSEIEGELARRGGMNGVAEAYADMELEAPSTSPTALSSETDVGSYEYDPFRVEAPADPPLKTDTGAGTTPKRKIFDRAHHLALAWGPHKDKFFALPVGGRLAVQVEREEDEHGVARFHVLQTKS